LGKAGQFGYEQESKRELIFLSMDEEYLPRREYKRRIREDVKEIKELIRKEKHERHAFMQLCGNEIGNKAVLLIQPLLFHSVELMESAISDVRKGRLLPALSSIRTHYEVTGTMAIILRELRGYASGKEWERNFLENLKKLTLGVGKAYLEEYPEITFQNIHVLERIRCVDEVMPYEPDPQMKPTMLAYNDLCEFVHLNFSTWEKCVRFYTSGYVDLLDPDKAWLLRARALNWLAITSGRFWLIYREVMHILNQTQKLPHGVKIPKFTYAIQRFLGEKYAAIRIWLHRKRWWKIKKK